MQARDQFNYARLCFIAVAASLGTLGAAWLVVTEQSFSWRLFWGALLGLVVFVAFPAAMRRIAAAERRVARTGLLK